MNNELLVGLLRVAGLLHVGLVWAGASMPKAVGLKSHLLTLPPFIRRLFIVYFIFIGLMLAGFGALTFCFAPELAGGSPLARGFCTLLIVFWAVRLAVAAFVFDVRPYLKTRLYHLGYLATNLVFAYLLIVYILTVWNSVGATP